MNYKETLNFVAKCLTISLEFRNKQAIEKQLQTTNINWDRVVQLSTSHYVFPALYCNLKRSNFLDYLPEDLVTYMEYIANLNRERNKQIIVQANELNNLLLANKITAIFMKGTGNLIAGIYDDLAERMVGDIDFIFSKKDYPKAIKLLKNYGYSEVGDREYYFPPGKHYTRLQKNNSIAAIEIHSEIIAKKKYRNEFNYGFVEKNSQTINNVKVLSYTDKLNLSIIANQINDNGIYFKSFTLRNAYDIFLLSKKTNAKDAVNTLNKLNKHLNCFLAICFQVFGDVNSLEYNRTTTAAAHISAFNRQFTYHKTTKIVHKLIEMFLTIKSRLNIIYKAIIFKEFRIWLFKRITDKNWYKQKLIKLFFKNNRS